MQTAKRDCIFKEAGTYNKLQHIDRPIISIGLPELGCCFFWHFWNMKYDWLSELNKNDADSCGLMKLDKSGSVLIQF